MIPIERIVNETLKDRLTSREQRRWTIHKEIVALHFKQIALKETIEKLQKEIDEIEKLIDVKQLEQVELWRECE